RGGYFSRSNFRRRDPETRGGRSPSEQFRARICRCRIAFCFFFSSRRRHTRSVSGIPAEPLFRSQTFFLISWFSLLLLQLLRHLFYRHLKLHRQRYILIV